MPELGISQEEYLLINRLHLLSLRLSPQRTSLRGHSFGTSHIENTCINHSIAHFDAVISLADRCERIGRPYNQSIPWLIKGSLMEALISQNRYPHGIPSNELDFSRTDSMDNQFKYRKNTSSKAPYSQNEYGPSPVAVSPYLMVSILPDPNISISPFE